ncbi:GNAT superfamily N-acetyltransferase [Herbaspirillum sp. 1130]|nr:GNAT superfamily N-acetyltransferase [Herbaspirillum sp. 1130]
MYSTQYSMMSTQMSVGGFAGRSELHSRLLLRDDLPALKALRDEVLAALPDPDCYVRESDEHTFLLQHLGAHGATIGIFHEGSLVAYAMLALPHPEDPANLGAVIGLPPRDRMEVAHLASCMVREGWRGIGLQRALLAARLALARGYGRNVCMGMVSLRNHSSRHNMLRSGMHIAWAGDIDGLQRQLTLIDMRRRPVVVASDERLIGSDNLSGQQQALAAGYIGVGEQRSLREVHLRFQRRLPGHLPF